MEPLSTPVRAKRGCLWYAGVAIAGAIALFVLFIVILIVSLHNSHGQYSTVVSVDDQTYLAVETSNHGEGFLDGYDWAEIYYVRNGWIWDKRVKVYEIPHVSGSQIGLRRRLNQSGQLEIEVRKGGNGGDSTAVGNFVLPASFPDN
ncbi:MAG TPA: hypothetical protein VFO93_07345 [Hymenobacter sp.]|uniref:hypothetical protein n=1 Tax=Hymenobacter sp. TaxID=1898978 RepID=UPI002D7FE398|nr:hypothetical protein [Hymenobacter sp.]HET9503338.1 hypothetical protein [Hymenobacter sp.]